MPCITTLIITWRHMFTPHEMMRQVLTLLMIQGTAPMPRQVQAHTQMCGAQGCCDWGPVSAGPQKAVQEQQPRVCSSSCLKDACTWQVFQDITGSVNFTQVAQGHMLSWQR